PLKVERSGCYTEFASPWTIQVNIVPLCSFREPRSLLCYDHVHRNVIRLRVNRQKRLLSITHPQLEWRVFHRCECQVEETTSIPQAITSPVKADDGAITTSGTTSSVLAGTGMFQTPLANGSPGLQSRKTSGLPRSLTTGRAHRPPRSKTPAIKPRKSGSPRKGQ